MTPERRHALSAIGFQWSLSSASPETIPEPPKRMKKGSSRMTAKAMPTKRKGKVKDYRPPRAKLEHKDDSPAVPVRYIPTYTTVYTVDLDYLIAGMKDGTMNYETAIKELEKMRER